MLKATAALVAAAGIWLAVSAVPNAAASTGFFGLSSGPPFDSRDIPKMRSTGVRMLRVPLVWASIQPRRPPNSLQWGATDRLVGDLAARGIRPFPFVYGSPGWVAKKPKQPPLGSPTKVRAWRTFLTGLVDRYGPGGAYWHGGYQHDHPGARAKPITAWEIWNEPNLRSFFPQRSPARTYAKLVKVSHDAITAADPRARIVLAGVVGYAEPTAWAFLRKLYAVKRIKRYFDVAAVHPYSATIGQFRTIVGNVRRVLKAHHDGATALWLTEVGWGSAHHTRREPLNKGRRGQKRMLQRSFNLVLHKRKRWHVGRLFWFDWRDPIPGTHGSCHFCDSSGLLRHNHEPKPSYRAFKRFARSH
jgi:polysaccharide biosynthesis protein PslG